MTTAMRLTDTPIELCSHIPAAKAVLCVDCEVIYDMSLSQCPSCTSKAVIVIARLLAWRANTPKSRNGWGK